MKKGLILALALIAGLGLRWFVDKPNTQVTLSSAAQSISLTDSKDSRLRVAYFGFTHCPDVCPTSLAVLSAALKQMDETKLNQLLPLFITLDPERDTPEKSAQYAQFFHPNIVGVSTSLKATKDLAEHYGVLFQKTEVEASTLDYAIDHSSYFYLIDNQGQLVDKVPHTMNPAILLAAIDEALAVEAVSKL